MSLDIDAVVNAIASHAAASGWFGQVNLHEPKSATGTGLTAAVFFSRLGPMPAASGLAATTTRVELTVRIYQNMLMEPQDMIDPQVVKACDALIAAYTGDFTLGGLIRDVDCLGSSGTPLSARSGYLNLAGQLQRIIDITVPCIVNDTYPQSP